MSRTVRILVVALAVLSSSTGCTTFVSRTVRTLLIALVVLSSSTGCATIERQRELHEPQGMYQLVAGESDLETCLRTLGAPLVVREDGQGAWLAWGWAERRGWSLTVSVPVAESANASLRYGRRLDGLEGAVLFFDRDWTLVAKRRGFLAEILPPAQVRAQVVE